MCTFIQSDHVMPGYICCICKGYNGLQRGCLPSADKYETICRWAYEKHAASHCALAIPATVIQCGSCLAGFDKKEDGTVPVADLTGKRFNERFCPVCGKEFKPL